MAGSNEQPGAVITPGSQPTPEQPQEQPPNGLESSAQPRGDEPKPQSVSWTASEFISHEKDGGWYVKLAGAAILFMLVTLLLTKDFVTAGVILFVFVILGVYANRKPRQLPYRVDVHGVQIGEKFHPYLEFRSFSIMDEGAFSNITLTPLKRFAPLTSLYYAPEDEDKILGILSLALPYEERATDPIDRLMQRIRF